jgi:glycosyltransferase involved in cell wall biosynthesis
MAARLPASAWLALRAGRLARADALDLFWATVTLAPSGPRRPCRWSRRSTISTTSSSPIRCRRGCAWPTARLFGRRGARRGSPRGDLARHRRARRAGVRAGGAAIATPAVRPPFVPPTPADVAAVRERYGLADAPYLLAVATREPRKNLALLVRAFRRARAGGGAAGAVRARDRRLGRWGAADGAGADDRERALGYVPDRDLPALYAGAAAFVFPSRYEGFGIPVLEARACGAVIIATDTPELREAGGPDATYCAADELALARALEDAAAGRLPRAMPAGRRPAHVVRGGRHLRRGVRGGRPRGIGCRGLTRRA